MGTDFNFEELLEKYNKNSNRIIELEAALKVYNRSVADLQALADELREIEDTIKADAKQAFTLAKRIIEIQNNMINISAEADKCLPIIMGQSGLDKVVKEEITKNAEMTNEVIKENKNEVTKRVNKTAKKAKSKAVNKMSVNELLEFSRPELLDICKEHNFKCKGLSRLSKKDLAKFIHTSFKNEKNEAKTNINEKPVEENKVVVENKPIEEEVVIKEETPKDKDLEEQINEVFANAASAATINVSEENNKHIFHAQPGPKADLSNDETQLFKNIDAYDDELNQMRANEIKVAKNPNELMGLGIQPYAVKNGAVVKVEPKKHKVVAVNKVPKETAQKVFGLLKSGKAKIAAFGKKAIDFVKDKADVVKTNLTEARDFTVDHIKTGAETVKNNVTTFATNTSDKIKANAEAAKNNFAEFSQDMKAKATDFKDNVAYEAKQTGEVFKDISESVAMMAQEVPDDIKKAKDNVANSMAKPVDAVKNFSNNVANKVTDVKTVAAEKAEDLKNNITGTRPVYLDEKAEKYRQYQNIASTLDSNNINYKLRDEINKIFENSQEDEQRLVM